MDGNNNLSNSRGLHKELVMASPQETITKLNSIVTNYDAVPNLKNGSAANSLRSVGSAAEDSQYVIGTNAVAEGVSTKAIGANSHAEGNGTTASGANSHAEGGNTVASGNASHAEGTNCIASGISSHAEGNETKANNAYSSHAEGSFTEASGGYSHAEGQRTVSSGAISHAEGSYTVASGSRSHSEGEHTIANHHSQHVFGQYNIADPSEAAATARGTYVEIVGNGTADNARSNARTLDWNGNEILAGTITAANIPVAPTAGGYHYLTALTLFGRTTYAWRTLPIYDGTVV